MFSLKNTVDLRGLKPEAMPALLVASDVYRELGYDCVVTSVTDSQHRAGSLHPFGYGVDLRTKNAPVEKHVAIRDEIAARLGPQFDVILESDHIHIEFDPR